MDRAALIAFMRRSPFWVEATVSPEGMPQAAVIGVAVTDAGELVFDTLASTRKATNLRANRRIALAMWADAATVQLEGRVDEPTGAELARLKEVYFATFPDGPTREHWEGILYFRVRPAWVRFSDFSGAAPVVHERAGLLE